MSTVERVAELDAAIAVAEQAKRLPQLKRERDRLAEEVEADRQAERERVEALVCEYEEARHEYGLLQDALIAVMPEWIERLELVFEARQRQDRALRAAEKVAEHDLGEKVQTIASRAVRYDEPHRQVEQRWRWSSRLDV